MSVSHSSIVFILTGILCNSSIHSPTRGLSTTVSWLPSSLCLPMIADTPIIAIRESSINARILSKFDDIKELFERYFAVFPSKLYHSIGLFAT